MWISDNAGPFVSQFTKTINEITGTKHRHGSSLHPQTHGAVEITNADLDQKLRFYVDPSMPENPTARHYSRCGLDASDSGLSFTW